MHQFDPETLKGVNLLKQSVLYRSKDDTARSRIKKSVLKVMRGFEPEDKQEAWGIVFTYLRLDDLQKWAIEQYGDVIELGDGPSDAPVCFVTEESITGLELTLLNEIMMNLKIDPYRVYRTSMVKSTDGSNSQLLQTLLQSEIGFIRPDVVIFSGSFAGQDKIIKYIHELIPDTKVFQIEPLKDMLGNEDKAKRIMEKVLDQLSDAKL